MENTWVAKAPQVGNEAKRGREVDGWVGKESGI